MHLNKSRLSVFAFLMTGALCAAYVAGRMHRSGPGVQFQVLDLAALNADLTQKLGNIRPNWHALGEPVSNAEQEQNQAQNTVFATQMEMRQRTTDAINKVLAEGWRPVGDVPPSGVMVFRRQAD